MVLTMLVGLGLTCPVFAFDEGKCTEDIGTAFNGQMGGRFCVSKIVMQNWFTAFSWCKAIGGHLATRDEACNDQISSCSNIKGSGRGGEAWTATPKDKTSARLIDLSSGAVNNDGIRTNNSRYALCK